MAQGKASVIEAHGDSSVLKIVDSFACRAPAANEVIIKQAATSVNPVDVYVRSGQYPADSLPKILGGDASGTVHAVGEGSSFKVGDKVMSLSPAYIGSKAEYQGTYAEYSVHHDSWIAPAPSSIPLVDAAAVPLVALTAWQALEKASPQPGQRIMITGASGGVGQFAIQFAKAVHKLHVTAAASARNAELVKGLGADEVFDYSTGDASKLEKFDIILDVIGGDFLKGLVGHALKPRGFITHVLNRGSDAAQNEAWGKAAAEGNGPGFAFTLVQPDGKQLTQIGKLIDEGKVKVVVAQRLPLEEAGKAQDIVIEGHSGGKVVLTM